MWSCDFIGMGALNESEGVVYQLPTADVPVMDLLHLAGCRQVSRLVNAPYAVQTCVHYITEKAE